MQTASIKVTFRPPPPPDGRPNFKPNGGHTYQIRNASGVLLMSGASGPDPAKMWAWAFHHARAKGFTHYTTPDHPEPREIPPAQ